MSENPRKSEDWVSRRKFLLATAAAAGCLAATTARRPFGAAPEATAQGPELAAHARPQLRLRQSDPLPRVVHVHNSDATSWDYSTGWYGDFVSQHAVNQMVDLGVMELTGAATRAAAWQALIPNYAPGQRVAIKANLVNATSQNDSDNAIDALIEPVNSIIMGLKELGVAESDIWVYDASRSIPYRFRNGCDFVNVQFSGNDSQGFSTTERVVFEPPPGGPSVPDQRISQVLVEADYLINMPIMKKHSHAWVTLSFKNHFGSIEKCWEVHDPTFPNSGQYTPDYNPMVDIYRNPHFVGKTVLTIGDGLYGSRVDQTTPPDPWITFGYRAPNSLFFSQDPVAIDCVMYDFLEAEAGTPSTADDYLVLAAQEGLGVFEHRASGASGPEDWYSLIDYVYLDLDPELAYHVYLPLAQR